MNNFTRTLIFLTPLLAVSAFAGTGGNTPIDGNYELYRTWPAPAGGFGHVTTDATTTPNSASINPNTGATAKFEDDGAGLYKDGNDRGICFHNVNGGTTYEWKFKNEETGKYEPISGGKLKS
ncbi:MAG: hypothetical protein JKY61_04520 [Planctomycetes bacterium]|nr:hypothetical protein [Planctomycetota bacterium]